MKDLTQSLEDALVLMSSKPSEISLDEEMVYTLIQILLSSFEI